MRALVIFDNKLGLEKDETKITTWITRRKMIEYVMVNALRCCNFISMIITNSSFYISHTRNRTKTLIAASESEREWERDEQFVSLDLSCTKINIPWNWVSTYYTKMHATESRLYSNFSRQLNTYQLILHFKFEANFIDGIHKYILFGSKNSLGIIIIIKIIKSWMHSSNQQCGQKKMKKETSQVLRVFFIPFNLFFSRKVIET